MLPRNQPCSYPYVVPNFDGREKYWKKDQKHGSPRKDSVVDSNVIDTSRDVENAFCVWLLMLVEMCEVSAIVMGAAVRALCRVGIVQV